MLHEIGTLGGEYSRALGMNDTGAVVGYAMTAKSPIDRPHAFLWQDGLMTDVGELGGDWAEARDVNDRLMVVGSAQTSDGEWHGFYWFDEIMFDLNDVLGLGVIAEDTRTSVAHPGSCSAPMRVFLEANAINEAGVILGCALFYQDPDVHGVALIPMEPFFEREPAYYYVDLGRLPGARDCIALGANDFDEFVGVSGATAFVCTDPGKGMRMLPLESEAPESLARAINNDGIVVGWSGTTLMQPVACVWQDGHRMNLGIQSGWISEANDISNGGLIVGWIAMDMGHQPLAVLWEGCIPIDLNTVTVPPLRPNVPWEVLEQATAIDDLGRIAGFGRKMDGRVQAFLLTPLDIDEGGWPN
jgi:probable HAF family extracellular repeat protein